MTLLDYYAQAGRRLQRTLLNACGEENEDEEDEMEAAGRETETSESICIMQGAGAASPTPQASSMAKGASLTDPQAVEPLGNEFAKDAAHGLWELAVERSHHLDFSRGMFKALVVGLSHPAWEVTLFSAGAVWQLARSAAPRKTLVELGVMPTLQDLAGRAINAPQPRVDGSAADPQDDTVLFAELRAKVGRQVDPIKLTL